MSKSRWIYWEARSGEAQDRRLRHKVYVSPSISALRQAFVVVARLCEAMGVASFKLGLDAHGILRSDKLVVYFTDPELRLMFVREALSSTAGLDAHGVPLTRGVGDSGLLSTAEDPLMGALSWRQLISAELVDILKTEGGRARGVPVEVAIETVGAELARRGLIALPADDIAMDELEGPLQLDPLVTLRPVAEYPLSVQERLSGAEDDYIVSERRSRMRAIRISAATAEMLKLFDAPKPVGEAIFALATRLGTEPHELLTEVFPTLLELRGARVLISEAERDKEAFQSRRSRLATGQTVARIEVIRVLDISTETEMYEVRGPSGTRAALKLVPASAPDFVKGAAERECLILPWLAARGLGGVGRLLDQARDAQVHHVFLAWQDGRTLYRVARDPSVGMQPRLAMARALVTTYARLHAVGVLHGDVHGGNVMVGEDGSICLIDFGAAVAEGLALPALPRIGLLEEHEPEAAAKLLAAEDMPDVTPKGEQYALANLLTLALTGLPALTLPLEEQGALEEIVHQAPRAWDMAGHSQLRALEVVLARALRKNPEEQFALTGDFADAVVGEIDRASPLVMAEWQAGVGAPLGLHNSPRRALHAQWGLASKLIDTGLPQGPRCSIYHGAAGIALGLFESQRARRGWRAAGGRPGVVRQGPGGHRQRGRFRRRRAQRVHRSPRPTVGAEQRGGALLRRRFGRPCDGRRRGVGAHDGRLLDPHRP